MDGVLIDTEKYLTRFWRQAAAEAGLLLSLEECYAFRSFAGKYAAPWFAEKYGEQYDYWTIRERRKELMQEHIRVHGIEKKDGVEEVLQVLSQEGYQTAVVTATDETRARQYLRDIGILELFDAVICANMVERGKPFPDVYLYACEKIQNRKNRRTVWRWRILQTESGRRMAPDVMW
nr:HAD hydrolase-like protein [Sellimonas intestinalis]